MTDKPRTTGEFTFDMPLTMAKIWWHDPFAEPKRARNRAEYLAMKVQKWRRTKYDR